MIGVVLYALAGALTMWAMRRTGKFRHDSMPITGAWLCFFAWWLVWVIVGGNAVSASRPVERVRAWIRDD